MYNKHWEKRRGIQLTELTVGNKKQHVTNPSGKIVIDNNQIVIENLDNTPPINTVDSTSDIVIPKDCQYNDFRNSRNSIINLGCSNKGVQVSKMTIYM